MRFFRRAMNYAKGVFNGAFRAIRHMPWDTGADAPSTANDRDALSLIPVYASIRILSEQISSLPWTAHRTGRDGVRKAVPLPDLLKRPQPHTTLVAWVRQLVVSLCLRGNAYGYVLEFDNKGQPKQVMWLNPDEVGVDEQNPLAPVYRWLGAEVPVERMIHIALFVKPGFVKGVSPIAYHAESIGVGLKAVRFGSTWYDHGGHPPGTFKNTVKKVTPAESKEIAARLENAMVKRRPLVYGSDWEFEALSVNPEEAQFIETQQLNATQVAAIFGVPPERVGGTPGGTLTYDSPIASGEDLHRFTVRPWLVLIEDAISARMRGSLELDINADALLRADTATRYRAHAAALEAGFMTPNEIRAIENLPPIEGGDELRTPQTTERPTDDELGTTDTSDESGGKK